MGLSHGLEECLGKVDHLIDAVEDALPVAALASAKPIENAWKRNVQTSFFKTGNYMRSIHSTVVAHSGRILELHIGTDIVDPPYPIFGEFGTSRMKARPTMTPAFEANKDRAIAEAEIVFKKVVTSLTS
jgi:HK97 gp10 family phage protein